MKLAHPAGVGCWPNIQQFLYWHRGVPVRGKAGPHNRWAWPPHVKAKHALGMRRLARSFKVCDQPCLNKSKAPSTNVVGTTPRSRKTPPWRHQQTRPLPQAKHSDRRAQWAGRGLAGQYSLLPMPSLSVARAHICVLTLCFFPRPSSRPARSPAVAATGAADLASTIGGAGNFPVGFSGTGFGLGAE